MGHLHKGVIGCALSQATQGHDMTHRVVTSESTEEIATVKKTVRLNVFEAL